MNAGGQCRAWVGRPLLRLEDPALVTGQGRFTADLRADHWVRFVRSPVAAGTIERITAPEGVSIVTAADLIGLKPIRPMLHKFGYAPVEQPILASGVVRFVGEPVAAVVAASEAEAEDLADLVELVTAQSTALVRAEDARANGACTTTCRETSSSRPGTARRISTAPAMRRPGLSRSKSVRDGRMRRRSRRAAVTLSMTKARAAFA